MAKRILLFLITLTLILASACASEQPTASPTSNEAVASEVPPTQAEVSQQGDQGDPEPGYPAPAVYDPYPGIDYEPTPQIYATSGPIPEPDKETGVVVGRMLENGKPAVNALLYLAEVAADDEGIERVASYDRATSPRAYVDPEGQFVFITVPPGKYGLVLDTVVSSYLLHKPDEEAEFLFIVVAGEETDLGDLDYDSLPLPVP